jgi:hypothetical protein
MAHFFASKAILLGRYRLDYLHRTDPIYKFLLLPEQIAIRTRAFKTETTRTTWKFLLLEIRLMILEALIQSGESLVMLPCLENGNRSLSQRFFHMLRVTPSRLAGFNDATKVVRRGERFVDIQVGLTQGGSAN